MAFGANTRQTKLDTCYKFARKQKGGNTNRNIFINSYQLVTHFQDLPLWENIEGEQKLSTPGQMSKQAQLKKYMGDQAVL